MKSNVSDSSQVGTIFACVDGEQVELGHMIITTTWEHNQNFNDELMRCHIHKGVVGVKMDEQAMNRHVRKIKFALLRFAIKNLFTKS